MPLITLEKLIWRYRRLVVVLIAISMIQFFELALLHIKYDIFTGGFLQPYAYRTLSEKIIFLSLSLWYDFLLCGSFAIVWFYVADRLNKSGIIIYYNFTVILLLIMGVWLGLKFKVLSYFNDTINYQIIVNLGGGSLKEGIFYAINEIALFTGIIIVVVVTLLFSTRLLKNHQFIRNYHQENYQTKIFLRLLLGMILLTPFLTYEVSKNNFLRYGMEKKTTFRIISKGLDLISDFDGDGFGSFGYPKDSALFDPHIFPGALDIPGNKIDEDGFLGDAQIIPLEPDRLQEIAPRAGKHIILVVLETARADLLDHQQNGRSVAPVMQKIANTGTSVKFAYSHTGYTTTSLTALFNRSLIQHDHQIKLIDFLHQSGYQISIISGQDESFGNIADHTGMNKENVYYFDARTAINDRVFSSKDSGSLRLSEERVVEQFQKRFQELDLTNPQFIYLNFQAAHFPYSHPNMQKRIVDEFIPRSEINSDNRERVAATYWNAIANADWAVGQIVETLKKNNLYDKTTLVILGDHGESLFEDGFLGHGHAINDAQTHIPLIFNDPEMEVQEAIGQTDIAEMAIRSAFGLTNEWLNPDKTVFQLVGGLKLPALIGHVKYGGERIVFDFRSQQAFFSKGQTWQSYNELMADPIKKDSITRLIREWETLKWNEFNFKNNSIRKINHALSID